MIAASTSLSVLVWALMGVAALASDEGRFMRSAVSCIAVCVFAVFSMLGITPAPIALSAWLLIVSLAAIASLGPPKPATSLVAFAFAGIVLKYTNSVPIEWLSLAHQVALLDLASASSATVALVLLGHESSASSQMVTDPRSRCIGIIRGPMAKLACGIFLRNSLMLLTLVGTSFFTLLSSNDRFESQGILGIWTTLSEALAAFVAWQIVRGGTPGKQKGGKHSQNLRSSQPEFEPASGCDDESLSEPAWSSKIAFAVAGISASLALLLVPLILNAASELDW